MTSVAFRRPIKNAETILGIIFAETIIGDTIAIIIPKHKISDLNLNFIDKIQLYTQTFTLISSSIHVPKTVGRDILENLLELSFLKMEFDPN